MDLMQNGWWQVGSVSALTGYGTTLPAIRVSLTRQPEISLPRLTHNRVECGPGSRSLPRSPRMRRTTRSSNEADDACDGDRWRKVLRFPPGCLHAPCCDQREGGGRH